MGQHFQRASTHQNTFTISQDMENMLSEGDTITVVSSKGKKITYSYEEWNRVVQKSPHVRASAGCLVRLGRFPWHPLAD